MQDGNVLKKHLNAKYIQRIIKYFCIVKFNIFSRRKTEKRLRGGAQEFN